MRAWISATAESKTGEAESTDATASATRAISDGVERMGTASGRGCDCPVAARLLFKGPLHGR